MILFLNKKDLFELKIKSIPLTVWAPEYDGPPGDVNAAFEFLRQVRASLKASIFPYDVLVRVRVLLFQNAPRKLAVIESEE